MLLVDEAPMESDEIRELRSRVERLEAEVDQLRESLQAPDARRVSSGPPPVVKSPFAPAPLKEQPEQEPISAQNATQIDTELKFGSQVLPRVGIGLVLIGVLILVAKAIELGWITPTVQFFGEIALCAVMIVIGLLRINLREDFGQVLIGGGSCGLYLSFAGGHVYKHLYEGETLVALFLALSAANFALSWWRTSRSFWVIGFLGGLVAASLPMDRSNTTASLWLVASIAVPALLLAARNTWLKAIVALWAVTTPLVLYIVQVGTGNHFYSQGEGIALFCAFSILPVVAYLARYVETKFDNSGAFPVFVAFATSLAILMGQGDNHPVPHSLGIALLCAALFAMALPYRQRQVGRNLMFGSIGAATALAPVAFEPLPACMTYVGLSLAASLVSRLVPERHGRTGVYFAASYFALAGVAYAVALSDHVPPPTNEYAMLSGLALALVAVTLVANRLEKQEQAAVSVAALMVFPIVSRGAYISSGDGGAYYAMLVGQSLYSLLLSVVAWRAKWKAPAALSLGFGLVTSFLYWIDILGRADEPSAGRQMFLLALVVAAVVPAVAVAASEAVEKTISLVIGALLGWFGVCRILFLVLTLPSIGMEHQSAASAAFGLYGAILIALGFLLELKALRVSSFVVFGVTIGKILLVDLSEVDAMIRVLVLVLLGAILIAGGYIYVKRRDSESKTSSPEP